ncbi:MAG: ABC transporter permease [Pseudomonadota bacterium]
MLSPTLPPPSTVRAIPALILREVATGYGRTPGGWIWAVVEPVAAIALLSYIFAMAFNAPPVGQSFALFYALGYLPFMAFLDISNKLANALRFSRHLLAYPALARMDAFLARLILNTVTQLVVAAVVLIGILVLLDTGAIWSGPMLVQVVALTVLLSAGVGLLNAALFARVPLWERLWQIAMRPMFIISGIFFVQEDLPADLAAIAWWNPLIHITGFARAAAIPSYSAPLGSSAYVVFLALALLFLGLLSLRLVAKDPTHV